MAKRKWFPRRLSIDERRLSNVLWSQCESDLSTRRKRWNEFLDFCELNRISHQGDASIFDYVAQLVSCNMKPRTIKNYKAHVLAARAGGCSPLAALGKRLKKTISTSSRRHALDISYDRLVQAIPSILSLNPRVAAIVVAMVATGLRFADLWHLKRKFIRIIRLHDGWRVVVDVRRAKNIMQDICRRRLVIPSSLSGHFSSFIEPLLNWYNSADGDETVAVGTINEFNSYLSGIDATDYANTEHSERLYTSYSLRRFAFAAFIDFCTDELGVVDWERACRFSLHMRENTLQSFYHQDLADE